MGTVQAHRGSRGAEVVHKGKPLWRKSSLCGNENECVEVAVGEGRVFTRDSKEPRRAPLRFTSPAWTEFLHALTQGELDGP
ncbi:DUF397 domain-containing protein [Streptomyces sp. NPDC098781]|uniref:DUF397 domain-containing protein n=1 Tax=Streptomyces sp. NPDC098781 TaxID=3366097 RepID=UPI00381AEED7